MNLSQVHDALVLPWHSTEISSGRFLLTHVDCLGSIIFDETSQVIFPSTRLQKDIESDIRFYTDPKNYRHLDNQCVLQCESNALSNFKNPERYFKNPFKLFEAVDEKAKEGTVAVFAHLYQGPDGFKKWAWIRIECDDRNEALAYFEKAIIDLKSAVETGDEVKIARAENMLKYLTGVDWSRNDKVLQVGKLSDGYGWQWLTNASLCSEDVLADFGGDAECDVVRCTCGFSHSIAWGLGYTGQYVAELHRAYLVHNETCTDCQGSLR